MQSSAFENCLNKQKGLKKIFNDCPTPEAKYQKIIGLGKSLAPYPDSARSPDNLVKGCQSLMYLHAEKADNSIIFLAESDALISRGLAALLLLIYSGEPPEVILTCPPTLFEEIGIYTALSPSRSNGLASLFLSMKQRALFFIKNKCI